MTGGFKFTDSTPFPDNLACRWDIDEPAAYQKYYELARGYGERSKDRHDDGWSSPS